MVPAEPCDSFSSTFAVKNDSGMMTNSFPRGQAVTLELKITNNADTTKTLTTSDACPQVLMLVRSHDTQCLVYSDPPEGTACGAAVTNINYQAGETKTFTSRWPQTDTRGRPVSRGDFGATGGDRSQCFGKLIGRADFRVE